MTSHESPSVGSRDDLLTALCAVRAVGFVLTDAAWRVTETGGLWRLCPAPAPGADLRDTVPELLTSAGAVTRGVEAGEKVRLPWIERVGDTGRLRYYEWVVHRRAADSDTDGWVHWITDRTAYGRIRARIDAFYAELTDSRDSHDDG